MQRGTRCKAKHADTCAVRPAWVQSQRRTSSPGHAARSSARSAAVLGGGRSRPQGSHRYCNRTDAAPPRAARAGRRGGWQSRAESPRPRAAPAAPSAAAARGPDPQTGCLRSAPSPDLPWPDFATSAILALLTGEERKPLRAACQAGRDAVDAGITRLKLRDLSSWGGCQGAAPWAGASLEALRLPALRHLDMHVEGYDLGWEQHGAAHMRGAARLVEAHAASLRTLRLSFWITPHQNLTPSWPPWRSASWRACCRPRRCPPCGAWTWA
jgi:hypothetical protein